MRITGKKLRLPALALTMLVGFSGCDLEVTNPNRPDRERAIATPEDVETLISSTFLNYFQTSQWGTPYPSLAFNTIANRHSASWGNFGMNDAGREPREALLNTPSYTYRGPLMENMWEASYTAIAGASDGLRAIESGLEIGDGGEDTQRAIAFGKFGQGLSSCMLALWYDQAFIVDETTDLGGELDTVPYDQMLTYALGKLQEAIDIARSNSFVLPETWINGNALSNNELADLMVSYKARCRANLARTDAEAATTDWGAVAADAAAGAELTVVGVTAATSPWWSGIKGDYGQDHATWHRQHMDWAGMADVSGQYQAWLAEPLGNRLMVNITTPDQRYPPANADGSEGLYHRYTTACSFPPERGVYRCSHYGDFRWEEYRTSCAFCWFGPIPEVIDRELRLYEAEAALRQGNTATAVTIVNETRVPNGGLPAVVDGGEVPGGADCVPRKRYDLQGRCGDLRDALIYEHFEEIFQVAGGLEFFHGRRFDILPTNSPLHIPIPAKDLETLQRDVYTFGGGGEGSAGDPTPSIIPGDLNSSLERAAYALRAIEARAEALNASLPRVTR